MMITQSAVQFASGAEIPLPAIVSKSIIFVILGLFALALDAKREAVFVAEVQGRLADVK